MALNLDALGKKIGPFTKDYTWKDAVLYALGVGAGFSDLEYCYEKDLKVIPSFGITTIYDLCPSWPPPATSIWPESFTESRNSFFTIRYPLKEP